jgi:hypothetical protein
MKLIHIGLVLAVMLVLAQGNAFAQSELLAPISFTIGPDNNGAGASTPISFASFNTALGTLNEVDLNYTNVQITGSDQITNNSATARNFTVQLSAFYTLTDSQGSFVTDQFQTSPQSQSINAGATFTFNETSGAPITLPPVVISSGLSAFFGNGSNITVTLGDTDPADLSGAHDTSWTVSTSANHTDVLTSTGTGTLQVTYIYTVPEPSQTAAWMLGFGLVLLIGRSFLKKFEFGSLVRQA